MEKIKEHKKDLILFFIVFLVSIVMCGAFLQPHYALDSYMIAKEGLTQYACERFLQDGSPFTAILSIFADMVHMPIEVYSAISLIFALIFMSCSVVLIYKICINRFEQNDEKSYKVMILFASVIFIFNYCSIELMMYLESGMLALGVLLSIIACNIIIKKQPHYYVKSFLLLVIAAFCYQGSIAVFPILLMTYYLLFDKKNIKGNIIIIAKAALIYGLSMLLTILYSNVLFHNTRILMSSQGLDLKIILETINALIIKSLNIIPPYVHLLILAIVSITIFFNKVDRMKILIGYIVITIASIAICLMPTIAGSGLGIEPRTCIAFGATIGISLIFMLYSIQNANKFIKILSYTFISVIFILNIVLFIIITNQHILTNKADRENCKKIEETILEYETTTGIKVTKIAAMYRPDKDLYYPNIIHAKAITQKALNSWAVREAICFYLKRDLEYKSITKEQYLNFFVNEKSEKYTTEPIAIEGDVIYFNGG